MQRLLVMGSAADGSRWLATGVVAFGFLVLFPPGALEGRYSILEASLMLLVAALVASRPVRVTYPVTVPTVVLLLLVMMTTSGLWSSDSWATVRDGAAFAVVAAVAFIVARTAGVAPVVMGIVIGGMVVLLSSALLLLVNPSAAFYFGADAVQGVFTNRNTFGYAMLQTLPAALALAATKRPAIVAKAVVVSSLLVAIAASRSQTSIIGAAVVLTVWLLVVLVRRWRPIRFVAPAALLVGLMTLALNFEALLGALGKDASLSGRVQVWQALVELLPESPLLGFGWSRSWPETSPHSLAVAETIDGTVLFHAHNELLNWTITLGAVGAVLVLALYAQAVWGSAIVARAAAEPESLWPFLAVTAVLTRGVTEISETNAQGWFILMLVVFICAGPMFDKLPRSVGRLLFLPTFPRRAGESGFGGPEMRGSLWTSPTTQSRGRPR